VGPPDARVSVSVAASHADLQAVVGGWMPALLSAAVTIRSCHSAGTATALPTTPALHQLLNGQWRQVRPVEAAVGAGKW
jgi:hypothetical protein